ncbi:M20 aminoacylase family protein [Limoniibacter endophyticus]|uniref:Amidohydrolase n=1 Tax=Limoniibacter endophyticus TaxID=1565040 RepID=A0A8J3GID6_9HYPH|nr:M20 aminoacylase family protein [Limoniibacter endophyticus]GHC76451.1 amidohydrolase [Limoniibacter endophyticus]
MPILNSAADLATEATQWRRTLHTIPELDFALHKTSAFVAERLAEFGCDDIVTGVAKTGIVATIKGRLGAGPAIALRADMDALPIDEASGVDFASTHPGIMHACGHDGHVAMLLGAAKHLAETRNFAGTVVLFFQPAEEGGGGGNVMVKEGVMDRFSVKEVYGLHNMPGLPVGAFATTAGPIMAATAEFDITITGKSGHAAMPDKAIDPVVIGSQIIGALQTIASRSIDPLQSVVVSATKFHAGDAYNVIPDTAVISGTVRTLDARVAETAAEKLRAIATGIASAQGASAFVDYRPNYPVTVNHRDQTEFALSVAQNVFGAGQINPSVPPLMAGEDFSYMLNARPGNFSFIGNGPSAALHNARYAFNDDAIAHGISYWVALAEKALKAA